MCIYFNICIAFHIDNILTNLEAITFDLCYIFDTLVLDDNFSFPYYNIKTSSEYKLPLENIREAKLQLNVFEIKCKKASLFFSIRILRN